MAMDLTIKKFFRVKCKSEEFCGKILLYSHKKSSHCLLDDRTVDVSERLHDARVLLRSLT